MNVVKCDWCGKEATVPQAEHGWWKLEHSRWYAAYGDGDGDLEVNICSNDCGVKWLTRRRDAAKGE